MAKIEIYTWQSCPFCIRAKALLERKGLSYIEYSIDGDQEARSKMSERAKGKNTVPRFLLKEKVLEGAMNSTTLKEQENSMNY